MTGAYRGPLITWTEGPADTAPVLLLHDRFNDQDELQTLCDGLKAERRVIRVRGARTQMEDTYIKGYYWYYGPVNRPELSTLGDALYHLQNLVLHLASTAPEGRISLVGKGEGGVVALLLAMVWPDRIDRLVSIDGVLPDNLDSFPLDIRRATGLPALLIGDLAQFADTTTFLDDHGWSVETDSKADAVAPWLLSD